MARYTEHDTSKIYRVADAFRANCLLRDGSLLFDGASVWRPDTLDRIHKEFVATPDEGDRSFIVKFKDQIGQAGQEVVRLAAEILCVYFLFPSNVGGPRKRQVVNEVLGWTGDSLPESHLVSGAFSNGIGSGGQGYNTRRPFEIAFLIDFVIAWKKLPSDRQAKVPADPWLFQEFIDSIEEAESKQLRHMLLYLHAGGQVQGVVDAKYKSLHPSASAPKGPQREDLYQMAAYLGRFIPEVGRMSWGVLAYPLDPARPSIPQAEQLSPWSLDGGRKVVFTSLPHVASDAVTKLRALMAPVAAERNRWQAQA